MFVAGVELDLALVRVHRRAVISYGVLTFALPMLFGTVIGLALGWSLPAALLLGSLLASHTLLLYPTSATPGWPPTRRGHRRRGHGGHRHPLADGPGRRLRDPGGGRRRLDRAADRLRPARPGRLLVGLLPRLVRLGSATSARSVVRYLLAIAAFLAAATLAESFGIEGIVGAFFAGLALNRLVPNEGPLMERIDFFGWAVFVPIFLVSVGMLLDPKVMVQPRR